MTQQAGKFVIRELPVQKSENVVVVGLSYMKYSTVIETRLLTGHVP